MRAFLTGVRWRRTAIAWIAGYGLLLQSLLSGIIVTEIAATTGVDIAVLCITGDDSAAPARPGLPQAPRHDHTCVLCSLTVCGAAGHFASAAEPEFLAPPRGIGSPVSTRTARAHLPAPRHTPKLSRAPPLSA